MLRACRSSLHVHQLCILNIILYEMSFVLCVQSFYYLSQMNEEADEAATHRRAGHPGRRVLRDGLLPLRLLRHLCRNVFLGFISTLRQKVTVKDNINFVSILKIPF